MIVLYEVFLYLKFIYKIFILYYIIINFILFFYFNILILYNHLFTAHPSCIYSPEEMIQKAGSNWQCERCKSCTICCETSDAVSGKYIKNILVYSFSYCNLN